MSELWNEEDAPQAGFNVGLWRRILRLSKPYAREFKLLSGAGMILAGLEACLPVLTGWVINEATQEGGAFNDLLGLGALYFFALLIMSIIVYAFIIFAGKIVTGFGHDLRQAAFDHLQRLSFAYYDKRPVGWIMARLTSDVGRLSGEIPWVLLDAVWGSCFMLAMTVLMLLMNWQLALLVLGIVPPLVLLSIYFQRRLLRSQRLVRKTNSLLTAGFNEGITGAKTSKTLVREQANLEEFQVLSTDMYRYSVLNALQSMMYQPLVLSIGSCGVGLAFWYGGGQHLLGNFSLGELVTFMQFATAFPQPIQEIAARFADLQAAQASAERLQELLDTEPDIVDSPEVLQRIEDAKKSGKPFDGGVTTIGDIEFVDVDFHYKPEEPILRQFNLKIPVGQSLALVGETGSGKSTIASLVSRFYEPTAGEIRFSGVDYRQRSLEWLQSQLGIVLQSPHLFAGTVGDNIRYGRLSASDTEVRAAAARVGADVFIAELESGFDTEVGEGGNRLSTGQKQFVSLARAVLADPQLLILDEATSSLDTETEQSVQAGVSKLLEGRTSIIIAHRLSTIRSADCILVIDQGKIVESGSHEELLANRDAYYRLYTQQFSEEGQDRLVDEEKRRRA